MLTDTEVNEISAQLCKLKMLCLMYAWCNDYNNYNNMPSQINYCKTYVYYYIIIIYTSINCVPADNNTVEPYFF